MHPSTLAKRVHFLLLLAFIAFYFYGLGHLPLVGPDEPRYAQVGREMFLRGDWITPTLGGHTWFEKPALLYWMEIAAFHVFGVHDWSARLGPALCGVLTVVAIWLLTRQAEFGAKDDQISRGHVTSLIVASCLGMLVFSRGASFDIVITMTTTWALSCFLLSELGEDLRRQTLMRVGFYFFVGLSLLAKGLVGIVIPAGVIGFYYLLRREWPKRALWVSLLWGAPLAILVSAVWYGPVIYKHGWVFVNEFFVQHHFARYLSNKYHHPQPFYFYPAILLMLTLPWTSFLIDAFIRAKNWNWRGPQNSSRLLVFSLGWILFPILFFSFSGSKLPGYILPVLPAALILISSSVHRLQEKQDARWPMIVTGLLLVFVGVGGLFYGIRVAHLSVLCTGLAAAPFIIAGAFSIVSRRIDWAVSAIACSVLLGIVVVLNCAALDLSRRESTRDLLRLADSRGYSGLRVLALPGDDRSAEFYASGRVIYGQGGEVQPVHDVPEIVADAKKRNERLLAFVAIQDLYLYRSRPGVEVIGDNGKLALVCLY